MYEKNEEKTKNRGKHEKSSEMSKIDENSVQVTANETHMIIHRNVKKSHTQANQKNHANN